MVSPNTELELVPTEVFDEFRTSIWPEHFGTRVRHSRITSTGEDQTISYIQHSVTIAPQAERDMLEEMGVIEQSHVPGKPRMPKEIAFTDLGKQVIFACEGLFTPSESLDTRRIEEMIDLHIERGRLFGYRFGTLALEGLRV